MTSTGSQAAVELEIRGTTNIAIQDAALSQLDHSDGVLGSDGQQLEPADGGAAAWKLLCAAFVFEALLWGMRYCLPSGVTRQLLIQSCRIPDFFWCFPELLLAAARVC